MQVIQTVSQPNSILKLFRNEFSKPLSDMINLSFNQAIFPKLLEIANVTLFTKKATNLIVITRGLFLFYLILVKFMKNVCTLVIFSE